MKRVLVNWIVLFYDFIEPNFRVLVPLTGWKNKLKYQNLINNDWAKMSLMSWMMALFQNLIIVLYSDSKDWEKYEEKWIFTIWLKYSFHWCLWRIKDQSTFVMYHKSWFLFLESWIPFLGPGGRSWRQVAYSNLKMLRWLFNGGKHWMNFVNFPL